MKITCVSKEELLRRKSEYLEKKEKVDELRREAENRARSAINSVLEDVKSAIESELASVQPTTFDLTIRVSDSFNRRMRVSIDNGSNPHGPAALYWNYDVSFDADGNIQKESGSWSGLTAVTPGDIVSLKESVAVLEKLNEIDWKTMLNREVPQYYEFFKDVPPVPTPEMDFDKELAFADISDTIGRNEVIVVPWKYGDSAQKYIKVVGETPKTYKIIEVPEYAVRSESMKKAIEQYRRDEHNIRKDTLLSIVGKSPKILEYEDQE